ncbi:MAG: DUF4145 domain-containing protein [Bradyrhizobium sp.]|uniref:DUF4145 domain-containing protein n=1 Tax=Bradyrhizobium sp. TaxID=376 RepID=UPI0025C27325|nr:DUF4145 domain-containing protein [Bradyrhizobium sp.]MCA3581181.1 DUF4145 domain-containing protein [Bradyrhizobium sp.]
MAFNWTCPYCQHAQAVVNDRHKVHRDLLGLGEPSHLNPGYVLTVIGCSNDKCKKLSVSLLLAPFFLDRNKGWIVNHAIEPIAQLRILPKSYAKPQPEFIPKALRDDYEEACAISNLSPKASATLARRCLQGMIRDFCQISRARLIDEIHALRAAVDEGKAALGVTPDSVDAIDHVRSIGNIGAHMEKDINHIVDVEPEEAQILIELIESLFEEWYVARHRRQERFAKLAEIADQKKTAKMVSPKRAEGRLSELLGVKPDDGSGEPNSDGEAS